MTDTSHPNNPDRFRFLATYIAGRSIGVTAAPDGQPAHTNGQFIFVSAGSSIEEQRREMLVQAALLGAGSLDARIVKGLRARATTARRYLALEGHRVLAELARQIPLDATVLPDGQPGTATADESLEVARGRAAVSRPTRVVRRHQTLPVVGGARRTGRAGHQQRPQIAVRPHRHARVRGRRRRRRR